MTIVWENVAILTEIVRINMMEINKIENRKTIESMKLKVSSLKRSAKLTNI